MPIPRARRLSVIIGAYLFGATMLFSLGILLWTYQSSIRAMDREVRYTFEQRAAIARAVIDHQGEFLGSALTVIAGDPELTALVRLNSTQGTSARLDRLMADHTGPSLDVLLFVRPDGTILGYATSPFQDLVPLFSRMAAKRHDLISCSRLVHLDAKSAHSDLLLKSVPVTDRSNGRILGILMGGVVLNNNFALLEGIRSRVRASAVAIMCEKGLVASTDLRANGINQEILDNARELRSGEIVPLSADWIAKAFPLSDQSCPSSLKIVFAVTNQPFVQIRKDFLLKALVLGALSVLFFLLTILLIRRITLPSLNRLLEYSETVRTGDTESSFRTGRILEFNRLGRAMEAMVAELNSSRRYVADILDSMPAILIGVDENLTVTEWNSRAAEATGIQADQARGNPLAMVFPRLNSIEAMITEALKNNIPRTAAKMPVEIDGQIRFENVTVYPLSEADSRDGVVLVEDVTERVRIEEVMVQTEKMMSVGGLAAGMAHEINNPLGIILQSAQGIRRRMNPSVKGNEEEAKRLGLDLAAMQEYMNQRGVTRYIQGIREAGLRAAEIVRNMLDFSRKSESRMAPCDINALVEKTLELAANDYSLKKNYDFKRVRITREFGRDLPLIPVTQTEMEQVIFNIIKNAAEAMAQKPNPFEDPSILIRTSLDRGMLRLDIEDNGPGMDEDTRKRVFEPFFTTKPVGAGTGLGLSVSYFIVTQNHGGEFLISSAPGEGARFTLRLPLHR